MAYGKSDRNGRRGGHGPGKVTAQHLENVALWYLQRFAASAESLRRVLLRRVENSARAHGTDRAEGTAIANDIVTRFLRAGLLDDLTYARGRALSLHRRGVSAHGIRARLRAKGVEAAAVDAALAALAEEAGEPEFAAAIAYARRRRIGPYRTLGDRDDNRERDLAALARQGFDYVTARRVVDAADIEMLEAEADG